MLRPASRALIAAGNAADPAPSLSRSSPRRPPPGRRPPLTGSTITMERLRGLVATHGNGFGVIFAVLSGVRFAAGCHGLRPLCSINAPYFVVCCGYAEPV